MEKLLFKEDRKSLGVSFLRGFKPLFAPFRYAPLHKEGFENCKQYLGLKIKCKFETGLASLKCKHFLGRVIKETTHTNSTFVNPTSHPVYQNLQKSCFFAITSATLIIVSIKIFVFL